MGTCCGCGGSEYPEIEDASTMAEISNFLKEKSFDSVNINSSESKPLKVNLFGIEFRKFFLLQELFCSLPGM